jgi:hypothetical protein
MVVPTFHNTIAVSPVVFNSGADPPLVFHVTGRDDHVTVKAVPSSIISVMDCPAAQVPAVGVEFALSVHV